MIYDAIEGGMATITITFKVGHEIHQPLLFCPERIGGQMAARAGFVGIKQHPGECEPKRRGTL
jgi:hypothetical protein